MNERTNDCVRDDCPLPADGVRSLRDDNYCALHDPDDQPPAHIRAELEAEAERLRALRPKPDAAKCVRWKCPNLADAPSTWCTTCKPRGSL